MKPNIFFSHSSRDADRIIPIKNHIIEKAGNAIEIFMSSDGASIPFGKNWIKEIEDALKNCKLMFVWLTPNSVQSNWVHFETGHAYSRGIKVVPLGFDGINLEKVPGPVQYLQGFNINSAASLNNIVAVINREFAYTFPNFFDHDFYNNVASSGTIENSAELLKYISKISCIFPKKLDILGYNDATLAEDWQDRLKDILLFNNEKYTIENNRLFGEGYIVYLNGSRAVIEIDPLTLNSLIPLLSKIYGALYFREEAAIMIFDIAPQYLMDFTDDAYIVSSRLANTEVDLNTDLPNILFKFRNILFRLHSVYKRKDNKRTIITRLRLIVDRDTEEPIPLLSLLKLLKKRGILSAAY